MSSDAVIVGSEFPIDEHDTVHVPVFEVSQGSVLPLSMFLQLPVCNLWSMVSMVRR